MTTLCYLCWAGSLMPFTHTTVQMVKSRERARCLRCAELSHETKPPENNNFTANPKHLT